MTLLLLSTVGCWAGCSRFNSLTTWCLVSTALLLIGIPISLGVNPYVRLRADHYAESFFSALFELDHSEHQPRQPTEGNKAKKPAPEKTTRKRANGLEGK